MTIPNADASSQLVIAGIAFAATIFGGLIVGFSSLLLKQMEYLNDYNKVVLQKRISAYEKFEMLIIQLKISVMDADRRLYHMLFSNDEDWLSAFKLTTIVANEALWLSDEAFETTRKLNYLMFHDDKDRPAVIEFGKRHYEELALLREEMERVLARDMRSLHKVGKFLREKSNVKPAGFIPVRVTAERGLQIDPEKK